MHLITPQQPHPLFNTAATRRLEQQAAAALAPHTLMQRAGLAVARLARALAPHARTVWIACGPGNNGGDGLEAAMHLQRNGRRVVVTWLGTPEHAPADARQSWQRAQVAGVTWADAAPPGMTAADLCIDALLGIGVTSTTTRAPDSRMLALLAALQHNPAPVLAVDLPSGLDADTGQFAAGFALPAPPASRNTHKPRHTLSLLTLKPGLFTAAGRDAAGSVWLDDLGVSQQPEPPSAWLAGPALPAPRNHASHKGSYGDVAVVGGEGLAARGLGMTGAALLAASAALHAGAGRVLVALLDDGQMALDGTQPELMFRRFDALALEQLTVVCGCGGGEAVRAVLPAVLEKAARLVLDADALNAVAADAALRAGVASRAARGLPTVLTPHPLEAARLLCLSAAEVQAHRLHAAQQLTEQFQCVAVLKGSGTVTAAPGHPPTINPTGNARLATAGTGDVLAGMVGARLAAGVEARRAALEAVYIHGLAADHWPAGRTLTASALARHITESYA
ncbi:MULTISPECIES: NAD(P)H-hydrate dehydratase [unclassified Acidovorax]|uniref:NAD(P)H-hydrate dehydratase n=1 Tax=unclassified Acidovorax TaxID=2684926 RepID=UPI000B3FEA08|nr:MULTISPECIES: NAD(P)H-hydrate dehydratase [unclassified Acidovorax]MBP3981780.1 NAD(P)H-hydrate dehydratase [Acidovorax sp. JG5]